MKKKFSFRPKFFFSYPTFWGPYGPRPGDHMVPKCARRTINGYSRMRTISPLQKKNRDFCTRADFKLAPENEYLEPKKHFRTKKKIFHFFEIFFFFEMKKFSIFCNFLDLKIQLIQCRTLLKCIYQPQISTKIKKKWVDSYSGL